MTKPRPGSRASWRPATTSGETGAPGSRRGKSPPAAAGSKAGRVDTVGGMDGAGRSHTGNEVGAVPQSAAGSASGPGAIVRRRAFLMLGALGLAACTPLAPPAPRSPETLAREADALLAAGNADLALKLYIKALTAGRNDAGILAGISTANLLLGHEGEAERYLRAALERDDSHVPALNNLGVLLARRGELATAIRLFRAAFALSGAEDRKIAHNLERALAKKAENPYAADREEGAYAVLLPVSG